MNIKQAKDVARRWVMEGNSATPGFIGALFHGSTAWLPDTATFGITSDVDVMVVTNAPAPHPKPGKLAYHSVLLDVSTLPWEQCNSPERILGNSHLAGSFRNPDIIADPTGQLAQLQAVVSRNFAQRDWVVRRCEHAVGKIRANLASIDGSTPLHDRFIAWLFATGVTTHVLLVAGWRNPTVRKRYAAVRDLLTEYGHPHFHETLLELLGCADMSKRRAEHHLDALADTFDATMPVVSTPLPFASDISRAARPIAIDGSRELVERGDHREAIFWIAATYARCMVVLYHDAPELHSANEYRFRELLTDLGITSSDDLKQRGQKVEAFLPMLWEMAETIIAANPEIVPTRRRT